MSNYYEMKDSKLALMEGLKNNGWKIYGYKPDQSDAMTDYYNPAHWEGIATKDGFVLVIDQHGNGKSGYEIKEYDYSNSKNNNPKIEKLYATLNDKASSDNEKAVCERKIEQLKDANKSVYKVIETYPTFENGNPKRSNWHIEKDGVIVAKGTGIASIWCGYSHQQETEEKVNKFISKFEKAISSNFEMVAKEVKEVKKVVKFVESDNKNLIEDETVVLIKGSFTGSFHSGAKVIFKKSYTTKNGAVSYEFRRLGKRNNELKLKSENMFIVNKVSFDKWIANGLLVIGSMQEVEEITTKTVYVKQKRTIKETTQQTETVTEIATTPVIETAEETKINNEIVTNKKVENDNNDQESNATVNAGITYKLNDEKNGVEIYFTEKPSEEVRNELKANKFRWSRYNKCWYAKQSGNTIELAKRLAGENINNNDTVLEPVQYEEININDLDSYTISESLSKAENDAHYIFRKNEKDHNKIVRDLFEEMNGEVIEAISKMNNDYYIYRIKTLLQSTKKKYHNVYVSWLNAKVSCPSWVVTGRAGRSASRYEKGMSRIEKWEREKWAIIDNFNKKLEYYQYKEIKEKENKTRQEIEKAMQNVDVNSIQFTTRRINLDETKYKAYGQLQCYVSDNYFIVKLRGAFRIFDLTTKKEIHAMKTKEKLTDAKKYVAYLINQDQQQKHEENYKEGESNNMNKPDNIIDFNSAKSEQKEGKEDNLKQFRYFMKEIYPYMTQDDFNATRNATNKGAELQIITRRIESERQLKKHI